MNIHTELTDNMTMIAAPELAPFREQAHCACNQCGASLNRLDRFKMWLFSRAMSAITSRYCAGGKAPTEPMGGVEAIIRGKEERFNPCAGVTEPHLHLGCKVCGFEWLMRVKASR